MVRQPTVISTFAGCGGSSLGYNLAGYDERLAIEWNNNAVATFRLNFPDVPVYHGDITKLTSKECMRLANVRPGELDVLDGSPPCQGFSTAGKRRFDDPRNSLFKEYARLLKDLRPRAFVMENVTGMIKGHMKQAYLMIVKSLRSCGYRTRGEVMNAMYFNVPQGRRRVVIVGVRDDLDGMPSHPLPQTVPQPAAKALSSVVSKTYARPLATVASKIWASINPGENGTKYRSGYYMNTVKVHPNKPVPTIPKVCPGTGGLMHWSEPRTLTIEEILRASSFPDDFRLVGSFSDKWARIGNAVPPNLMQAIAIHVREKILDG